jgi:imidazolonepropionase-like amidohydrolase
MEAKKVNATEIRLAISGAQLIDGVQDQPRASGVVLIDRSGRIASAGAPQEIAVPDGVPTVDAHGMTLLPGLIDGHVHLAWDKTLYTVSPRDGCQGHLRPANAEHELVRAGHHAQMALAAGVTTLRDCGSDDFGIVALRDAINAGNFLGPRILASGRPVTTGTGHLYSGWSSNNAAEIRNAVHHLAERKVDFIKLVASGGMTTPRTNITGAQYTLEEIRAAVEAAHSLGRQVAAHAISTESIRLAAEAGVDTIEHCSWISADPRQAVTDETAVDWMVKQRVRVDHAVMPRLALFPDEWSEAANLDEAWWWNLLRVRWPFLRHMQERGICVFLGTDAAFGPWPGTTIWPGFQDLARAVEVLVRHGGFRPMAAIQMITREPARALRWDAEIGTIASGKRADLILLAGDPLQDIRALREAEMVFRDGRMVAQRGQLVFPQRRGGAEI